MEALLGNPDEAVRLGGEARYDVVAVLARSDLVSELATAPVTCFGLFGRSKQAVKTAKLFIDCGVFEC